MNPRVVVLTKQREVEQGCRSAVDPVFDVMAIYPTTCVTVSGTVERVGGRGHPRDRARRARVPGGRAQQSVADRSLSLLVCWGLLPFSGAEPNGRRWRGRVCGRASLASFQGHVSPQFPLVGQPLVTPGDQQRRNGQQDDQGER